MRVEKQTGVVEDREKRGLAKEPKFSVIVDCEIGENTVILDQVNLYKCKIGRDCRVGQFVAIEGDVVVGNRCKIEGFAGIGAGSIIEDDVFIGPGVLLINDKKPQATGEWTRRGGYVEQGASIGARAIIFPGVRIGRNAMVGAGALVTRDVPAGVTVVGSPAKPLEKK